MRITGCHIKAFGRFRDERFEQLDHPAVIILGDNETGKSTLRHFMTTMLYGIAPARADEHPYAPRDSRVMDGRMAFRCEDGAGQLVERRLGREPQARLVKGGDEALQNEHVPAVWHVPRSVFEAAYSLDVRNLTSEIEGEALRVLQGRLFRSLGAASIRPARQVVAELQLETEEQWRPDAAASSRAGQLERRLDELAEERSAAQAAERRARRCFREMRSLEHDIEEGWSKEEVLRSEIGRIERLAPVRRLLHGIEELDRQAGDVERYAHLPEEPQKALRRQEQRITETEHDLDEHRRRIRALEEQAEQVTDQDRRLLKREADIETWKSKVESHERRNALLQEARQEKRESRLHLEDVAGRLLNEPWHNDLSPVVRRLSLGDLRQQMRDYEEEAGHLDAGTAQADALSEQAEVHRSVWPWILIAALGAAVWLAQSGSLLAFSYAAPVGVGLAVVGLLQAMASAWFNRRLEQPSEPLALEERKTAVEEKAALVVETLSALPLPQERLRQLDRDLLNDVQELVAAHRAHDERAERVQEGAEAKIEENKAVEAVASACGVEADSHELAHTVARLAERLETARQHRRAARDAETQLPTLREQVQRYEQRLVSFRREHERWTRALEEIGDGDLEAGGRVLDERRDAARRRRLAEDRLHRDFPDWRKRRAEIPKAGADANWSGEEEARLETRLQALTDRINQLRRRRNEKREQLDDLAPSRSSADLDSEREEVSAHLAERQARRDQLLYLGNIVRAARRRFREHNQPEALKTASDFARRITGARYDRVTLDDEAWKLRVEKNGAEQLVCRPPLSQGAFDQVQLAFRLALVHHLDEDREHLPVFLDEGFVNWDTARRRAAFDVLSDMMEQHQIFVFTCHPYFAREATDFLDGTMIRLSSL